MELEDLHIIGFDQDTPSLFEFHEVFPNIDNFTAFEIRGYTYEEDEPGYLVYAIDINDRSGKNSLDKEEYTKFFHIEDFVILDKSCHSGNLWLCNLDDFHIGLRSVSHLLNEGRSLQEVYYPSKESMDYLYAIDPEEEIEDGEEKFFKVSKCMDGIKGILEIPLEYNRLTYESFETCENPEKIKQIRIYGNKKFGDDIGSPFYKLSNLESFSVEDSSNLETIEGALYLNLNEQAYNEGLEEVVSCMDVKSGKILLSVPQNYPIRHFTIPEGTVAIRHSAFFNCTKIESLVLPDSITELGFLALGGMTSLKKVYVPNHRITTYCDHYDELEPFSFEVLPLDPLQELSSEVRNQWELISKICYGYEVKSDEMHLLQNNEEEDLDEIIPF